MYILKSSPALLNPWVICKLYELITICFVDEKSFAIQFIVLAQFYESPCHFLSSKTVILA